MKISDKTIEYLEDIISGNSEMTPYLSGPKLINYFSKFGFSDKYGPNFSRLKYCREKLLKMNADNRIEEVIEDYYNPINFVEDKAGYQRLVKKLNEYLNFDDLELIVDPKTSSLVKKAESDPSITEAAFIDGNINIVLEKNVFSHVKNLLEGNHYYNAVEEAYKIVREKLKSVSGKERATDAFKKANYRKIFGHEPKNQVEQDFFEGVKFLHMAIQFLRNEKAHKPATVLEKNLAIHYISLASLAYDLINRKKDE